MRDLTRSLSVAFVMPLFAAIPVSAAENSKQHRVAMHVDQNDPEVMNLALNNAKNVIEYYQKRGEDTVIEIVAYSGGLHMLRSDTSLVKDRIKEMVGNDATRITFAACNNTIQGMESVKVTPFPSSRRPSLFRQGSWNLLNFKSKDGAIYAHDALRRRRRGDRIRAGLLHLLRSVPGPELPTSCGAMSRLLSGWGTPVYSRRQPVTRSGHSHWLIEFSVDFRNENILAQRLTGAQHRSPRVDDGGRAERDSIRRAARNICADDHHFVVPGSRNVDRSGQRDHIGPFRRQAVVARHEHHLGAACDHVGGDLRVVGIVADHDSEREAADGEERAFVPCAVY